jgi:precorrin-2/cobalt-factor-2 C20-methyltransferase
MTNITHNKTGKLIGVGVGPGDPELLTLKAFRLIQRAQVLSFLINTDNESQAKTIASEAITGSATEIPLSMPMSKDRTRADAVYDQGAKQIKQQLCLGKDVVFLCEGDPLFFGSFAYLMDRLQDEFICEVVPGISSVNAAPACLPRALTKQTDAFAVVSGRHSDQKLVDTLHQFESVVIMKAGQSRPRILAALAQTGRTAQATYLEYIGREQQFIEDDVTQLSDEAGPYFSLFLVRAK